MVVVVVVDVVVDVTVATTTGRIASSRMIVVTHVGQDYEESRYRTMRLDQSASNLLLDLPFNTR